MGLWLFVAFVAVPLIELALLIELGGRIGTWPTVGLVVGTAALGSVLLRRQGAGVMLKARAELESGSVPVGPMVEAMMLAAAGLLLLTPGILTDIVGGALLTPWVRRTLVAKARDAMVRWQAAHAARHGNPGIVIDGDFARVDPETPPRHKPSPDGSPPPPAKPGPLD